FTLIKAQEKQDTLKVKQNSIFFADFLLGYSNGYVKGLGVSGALQYQNKNSLYSFRALATLDDRDIEYRIIVPISGIRKTLEEYAFLYGKRFIKDDFSYHFSGGISYNVYQEKARTFIFDEALILKESYVGFPLEIGLTWFKNKKERFGVFYGLIPVGKSTGFGRSFGLKLYANIAKKSYVGLGLSFGLGWHKIYDNEK
ncbi:MAG: hypothetical protein P8P88_10720, partial [Polaribacter sp.]|nr:hypothetical protein [Polaribacter sp.]